VEGLAECRRLQRAEVTSVAGDGALRKQDRVCAGPGSSGGGFLDLLQIAGDRVGEDHLDGRHTQTFRSRDRGVRIHSMSLRN
jgi:hypothetical protein